MKEGYRLSIVDGTSDAQTADIDLKSILSNEVLSPKEEHAIRVNMRLIKGNCYDLDNQLSDKNTPILYKVIYDYSSTYHCTFPYICVGQVDFIRD